MRGSHCLQDKVDSHVLYKVGANFLASSPTILPSQLNIEILVLQLVQSTVLHLVTFCSPPLVCLRCHLALGENGLVCSLSSQFCVTL